ncbi:MAG: undecaprenyl-phosphate alpha-N-acetylglucosaminyl 1-phosphate transferase [Kangiellaceae bacterium]|nr:undecaprenyl-phosphate alpha-N-acetylglucosaminyl 1-phosphate transferase [Kangiellaceae bacterium]
MHNSLIVSTIVCFIAVFLLRPIAVNWGLVDTPDNRKQHVGNIPLIGGLAIYLATLTSISMYINDSQHINLIIISISLLVFIGMLDDRYDLNAKLRLVAQVLIAAILTFGTDYKIDNLGNVFGFGNMITGPAAGVVTIMAILAGINAFNMTDGIDGLAGVLALISLIFISFIVPDANIQMLVGVLSASLIVFLLFNLGLLTKKNKIFMGDAGSMMLGMVTAWLLIVSSQMEEAVLKPAHVLWFIAVPLIDMVTVMFKRIKKGQSPLVADREHLHHVFMDLGFNSKHALLFIAAIALLFAFIGFYVHKTNVSEPVSLLAFLFVIIVYNLLLAKRDSIKAILLKLK